MPRKLGLPSIQALRGAFRALDELGYPHTSRLPLFASRCWSITTERQAYHSFRSGLCNTEEVAVPRWYWQRLPHQLKTLFLSLTVGHNGIPNEDALPEALLDQHGRLRWRVASRFGRYILHSRPEVQGDEQVYFGDDTLFLMRKARQCLPTKGQALVLDLCCGSGGVGLALPSFQGQLIGVDINPHAIELARLTSQSQGLSHHSYHCGEASSVLDQRYDLIVGNPPTLPPELGGNTTLYATGSCDRFLSLLESVTNALTADGQAVLTVFSVAEGQGERAPDSLRRELPSLFSARRGYRYTVRRQFQLGEERWLRHVALEILPEAATREEQFHDDPKRFRLPLLDWRRRWP